MAKRNERLSESESVPGVLTTVRDRNVGSYKKRYFVLLDEINRLIEDIPRKARNRLAELDRNGRVDVRRKAFHLKAYGRFPRQSGSYDGNDVTEV